MNKNQKKQIKKTLQLWGYADSKKGKVIQALLEDPRDTNAVIWNLILMHYLPYVIDKNDPSFEVIARKSIGFLEGEAKTLKSYAKVPWENSCNCYLSANSSKNNIEPPFVEETSSLQTENDNSEKNISSHERDFSSLDDLLGNSFS